MLAEGQNTVSTITAIMQGELSSIHARLEKHDTEIHELQQTCLATQLQVELLKGQSHKAEEQQKAWEDRHLHQGRSLEAMQGKIATLEAYSTTERERVDSIERTVTDDIDSSPADYSFDRDADASILRIYCEAHILRKDLLSALGHHWQNCIESTDWQLVGGN